VASDAAAIDAAEPDAPPDANLGVTVTIRTVPGHPDKHDFRARKALQRQNRSVRVGGSDLLARDPLSLRRITHSETLDALPRST
jgi:hypothetical protein